MKIEHGTGVLKAICLCAVAAACFAWVNSADLAHAASSNANESGKPVLTKVNSGRLVLKRGAKYSIGAKSASNAKVTYKSKNKRIATVTKKGVIKAKKKGRTTIVVRVKNGGSEKVHLRVVKPKSYKKAKRIKIKVVERKLTVGSTADAGRYGGFAKISISPRNVSNDNYVLSSSNKRVAKIARDGTLRACAPGTVKLKVRAADNSKVKASVKITVLATSPASDFTYKVGDYGLGNGAYITGYKYKAKRINDYRYYRDIVLPKKVAGKDVVSAVFRSGDDESPSYGIDVSKCASLRFLDVSADGVDVLRASDNPALQSVRIDAGDGLGSVNLSGAPSVSKLVLRNTISLKQVTFGNYTALRTLDCAYTQASSLDTGVFPNLEVLDCSHNQLTKLDVSGNPNLVKLDCSYNRIHDLQAVQAWASQEGHEAVFLPQGQ